MENLPPTIGTPTSTEQISTIVMATPSPTSAPNSANPAASTASPSDSNTSSRSDSSSTVSAIPSNTALNTSMSDRAASKPVLSTAQITGIAIGGAATAVVVFTLLMLVYYLRKRRRERRRSKRRSRLVEATPPPNYQSPQKRTTPTFGDMTSSLTVPTTNNRFYATQQTMEDKRRSFWRRSIRPEEIGVAISPKMGGEGSPVSTTSQQSMSRLLPTAPSRALWPAPLDLEATRGRKGYTRRPLSDATLLEDEAETRAMESESIMVDNQPFILEKPPAAKRQRTIPPPLRLPIVPENSARTPTQAVRIPLTPTYDNGNVNIISPPRGFGSPPSRDPNAGEASQGGAPQISLSERRLAPSSTYANRNVLRKNPPGRLPLRAVNNQISAPMRQQQPAPPPAARVAVPALERPISVSSVYTEIEEDTTPEEVNKQLGLRANPPTPSIFTGKLVDLYPGQESPIRDLKYPSIPRSAAVSRQAEKPAQPRSPPVVRLPLAQSTRDQLVRAEASFMQTDTTSSDGYLSDDTIEWPVPPLSQVDSRRGTMLSPGILKSSMAKVRSNATDGRRQPLSQMMSPSLNEVLSAEAKPTKLTVPQRSPSTKARLTPSKSKTGDLYLTVEI
ncbi:hypothetical protein LTR20_006421 [Exophiala xenobiotica]|nr:hypothetical protein LTR41_009270 [Exophiala xenobiotica]KAK5322634.1 hypothetical protein LTR93_005837 [Exophiala xenobiotica]KAK5366517.1 hypothetical protein LTS13_008278 [Exophiala xenobiotica]KAK5395135.1 hypothetical protein LTR79_007751 [Exophiala xenobiotica]KAK5412863.1 hypothetical protein LTR90_006985 [Exophiala xenobiotica]